MAELEAAGIEARAVEGARSQFDVLVDGDLVFSKQERGRFPEPGEVPAIVAS